MITSRLIPRGARRRLVDMVYGSDGVQNLVVYATTLWVLFLLLALVLAGRTPIDWRSGSVGVAVESLPYVTCSTLDIDGSDSPAPTNAQRRASSSTPQAADNFADCRGLSGTDVQELRTVAELASLIRNGAPSNTPTGTGQARGNGTMAVGAGDIAIATDGPARQWADRYICRLGGANGQTRANLAWYVSEGYGGCSAPYRFNASMPLTVWLGPILGLLLTPLLLGFLLFLLVRHSIRLPSTWRAYRRLYGSEHRVN